MRSDHHTCAGSARQMSRMKAVQAAVGRRSSWGCGGLTGRRQRQRDLPEQMPSHARRVCVHMPKTRCRVDEEDQNKLYGSNQASTPAAIRGQTISSSPSRLSWWRGRVSRQVGSMRSPAVRVTCPCRMQRWMFASSIQISQSSTGPLALQRMSGERQALLKSS